MVLNYILVGCPCITQTLAKVTSISQSQRIRDVKWVNIHILKLQTIVQSIPPPGYLSWESAGLLSGRVGLNPGRTNTQGLSEKVRRKYCLNLRTQSAFNWKESAAFARSLWTFEAFWLVQAINMTKRSAIALRPPSWSKLTTLPWVSRFLNFSRDKTPNLMVFWWTLVKYHSEMKCFFVQ